MKLLLLPAALLALAFYFTGWSGLMLAVALLAWLTRKALQRAKTMRVDGHVDNYQTGDPALDSALALAHPMAFHCVHGGIADAPLQPPDEGLAQKLRPMLLYHLGLRTDLEDSQVHKLFPEQLRQRWFRLDLQAPQPQDDARAAMAFACARVAFFVRCAHMMGWLPQDLQEQILRLNARRARDCFGGWLEFGNAYAQGRAQWVAQGRSDILGVAFTPADVADWTQSDEHPWKLFAWPTAAPPLPVAPPLIVLNPSRDVGHGHG